MGGSCRLQEMTLEVVFVVLCDVVVGFAKVIHVEPVVVSKNSMDVDRAVHWHGWCKEASVS